MTAQQTDRDIWDISRNLSFLDYVVHEWIGLAAYRFTGKAQ